MTKTEFKTLVRLVDRHHVETLGRIEEVKAEVAKVFDLAKWEKDDSPC